MKKATFAGGCFWCLQGPFDALPGVSSTLVGYCGGHDPKPTYEAVCDGTTGHLEAIEVVYDPALVSYEKLLDTFWRQIDPTQADGQFGDRGSQYLTAVFFHDEAQKAVAEASKKALDASGRFNKPIATAILPAAPFYAAEEHHQKYYQKKTAHYKMYRVGSGRQPFIDKNWSDKT